MALLSALLILVLVRANYLLHRDAIYPAFLQASLWFGAVSLFSIFQGMFVPVPDGVFALLVDGVLLFSMGAFVGSYDHQPFLTRNYVREGTLPTKRAVAALAIVVTLGFLLYVRRTYYLSSSGPSENAFINLRYALSVIPEETGGLGIAGYFIGPAYVLAAITVLQRHGLRKPTLSRVAVGMTLLVGLLFGVLSSGRGQVLALIVIVLTIPTVLRAVKALKAGLTLALLILILFAAVGIILEKGGSLGSTLSENWSTLRESFLTYLLAGIPALGTYLHNRGPDLDLGANSFRSVVAVLHALGFDVTAAPVVQPYIDVPMSANVYTVQHPYIKDFGTLGGALMLFPLGFVHSILYRRATVRNPHAMYVFLFALSLFPLVMQAFQDMYFSLLSMWIQYGAYAVAFFVLLTERHYQRGFRNTRVGDLRQVGNAV